MRMFDVLVVGGGPAGVSAAVELAEQKLSVLLIEQRSSLGGAIHREGHDGSLAKAPMAARHRRNWARLKAALKSRASQISISTETVFLGIDGNGECLLDMRTLGGVRTTRTKAIIFAVGASEEILPRMGWELPNVVSAGGLQVQLKETGIPPAGRILVSGKGPLPLALASQLTAMGNAPIALIESGNLRSALIKNPLDLLKLLCRLPLLVEALGYLTRLFISAVPRRRGYAVTKIEKSGAGLIVTVSSEQKQIKYLEVDLVVLHDGLKPNKRGLPTQSMHGILIEHAGDCQEILGADAAILDGRNVARNVALTLRGVATDQIEPGWKRRTRMFQLVLAKLGYSELPAILPETVICRCEGVTYRQLLADKNTSSAKEMRLNSRVGMGPCQGRFCSQAASRIAAQTGIDFAPEEIDGPSPRWPIRPVSVEALACTKEL